MIKEIKCEMTFMKHSDSSQEIVDIHGHAFYTMSKYYYMYETLFKKLC